MVIHPAQCSFHSCNSQALSETRRLEHVKTSANSTICRIENATESKALGITLHKVIEEYLLIHSPVSPKLDGRATATDDAATLLTQLTGAGYEFR